jgi:CheY-like chemotaxis protein
MESEPRRRALRVRILVVDDEPLVRAMMVGVLGALGHSVTATDGAAAALEAVRADPYGFDLMLADQTMPGSSGLRLAQLVHEIRPGLPVVLATGCVETLDSDAVAAAGLRGVLAKPFRRLELAQLVADALSGDASDPAPRDPRDGAGSPGGPRTPAA